MQEYSSDVTSTTLTRKDRTKYVPVSNSSDDVPQTMMLAQPPVTSVKNNTAAREPTQQQTQHPIMNRSIIQRSVVLICMKCTGFHISNMSFVFIYLELSLHPFYMIIK